MVPRVSIFPSQFSDMDQLQYQRLFLLGSRLFSDTGFDARDVGSGRAVKVSRHGMSSRLGFTSGHVCLSRSVCLSTHVSSLAYFQCDHRRLQRPCRHRVGLDQNPLSQA